MKSEKVIQGVISDLEHYIFAPVDDPEYDPTDDLLILEVLYWVEN